MKNIIVIGGSNSKKSINKILATHAAEQLEEVVLTIVDETDHGIHEEAKRLSGVFDWADGFVVSLAEHNGAYSAAFKNAFDWLSRINGKVWREKPVLLLATSPGGRGGQTVLKIAATSFPHLGAKVTGTMSFPSFFDNYKDGEVVNPELEASLAKEIANFQKEI
jgi:chromate reductase